MALKVRKFINSHGIKSRGTSAPSEICKYQVGFLQSFPFAIFSADFTLKMVYDLKAPRGIRCPLEEEERHPHLVAHQPAGGRVHAPEDARAPKLPGVVPWGALLGEGQTRVKKAVFR